MKAGRLAELLAGTLFLTVGLYSIHTTADLVDELDTARALVPGGLVYAAGVFVLLDFLLGSRMLSRLESRCKQLPVKVKLLRVNVAGSEVLLLALAKHWASGVVLVAADGVLALLWGGFKLAVGQECAGRWLVGGAAGLIIAYSI